MNPRGPGHDRNGPYPRPNPEEPPWPGRFRAFGFYANGLIRFPTVRLAENTSQAPFDGHPNDHRKGAQRPDGPLTRGPEGVSTRYKAGGPGRRPPNERRCGAGGGAV